MDNQLKPRFAVVANAHSGAAAVLGQAALTELIHNTLGSELLMCDVVESEFLNAALETAFASAAEVVVAIGGDGTCRSAATLARLTNKEVAFLPGGTMNLLPGRHWPNMDLTETLQALAAGAYEASTIDIGQVNDELFLIAVAFGAAPALSRFRESHRSAETLVETMKNLVEVAKVIPHLMRPSARLEAKGVTRNRLAALAIVVGNADLALGRLDADNVTQTLECVGVEMASPFSFFALMLRAFLDPNWRADNKVTTSHITQGKVYSKSRAIAMTLDGEVVRLVSPAHVKLLVNGLRVLVHAPKKLD